MNKISNSKQYDLEDRTLQFSKRVIHLCQKLPKNIVNNVLVNQLLRSATSVGANYIEANEALSKKDFCHRAKICRKEAKETVYWLNLIIESDLLWKEKIQPLLTESIELKKIFSSIVEKSK